MVAAGAVVTRDVADHALVAGNPAKPRGHVCRCGATLDPSLARGLCGCGRGWERAGDRITVSDEAEPGAARA
jgi:UDP-2-acetamido-3-amino-2,3-dideoxy-glucuronate N-acetyltransferase